MPFQIVADLLAAAQDSPPLTKIESPEDGASESDSAHENPCDTEDSTPVLEAASISKSNKKLQVDIRPSTRTRRVQVVCTSSQAAVQATPTVRSVSVQCSLLTAPMSDLSDSDEEEEASAVDPVYLCSESELSSCDSSCSDDDIGQNADTEEDVTE